MKKTVRIHFLLDDLLVEASVGTSLQEIAQTAGADLTFGCGGGSCGTCRVRIARGLEHCSPAGPEERDYLQALDVPVDHRLACQLQVMGDVDVEYIGNPVD